MIIRAAVTCSNFKKSMQILLNAILVTPTSTTTDAMALKCFVSYCKANALKEF